MYRELFFLNLANFGLFILIWLVQTIIYPSLAKMNAKEIRLWHPTYSNNISIIVIPLMVTQISLLLLILNFDFHILHCISLAMVILAWISTFLQAVPIHREIASESNLEENTLKIIRYNWIRTFLWSCTFVIEFFYTLNYKLPPQYGNWPILD